MTVINLTIKSDEIKQLALGKVREDSPVYLIMNGAEFKCNNPLAVYPELRNTLLNGDKYIAISYDVDIDVD